MSRRQPKNDAFAGYYAAGLIVAIAYLFLLGEVLIPMLRYIPF